MRSTDDRLLERYFAGDLDRVERRRFDALLATSDELQAKLEETYDRRTEARGLLALEPVDPELTECFSEETLAAHVEGRLGADERAMVAAHLACPWCRGQVEALERAASRRPPRRARRWAPWLGAAVAAAALLVIVRPPQPEGLGLSVEVRPGGDVTRTASARPGDVLEIEGRAAADRQVELRVYGGDGGLLLLCPGDDGCRRTDAGWSARMPLERRGTHRVVWIATEEPIPRPTGSLDVDLGKLDPADWKDARVEVH